MPPSDGLSAARDPSLRSRKSNGSPFLVLAAGLLFFAAIVVASFLVLRPVTLRIAVGPSGSDDQKLIQALAQSFAREGYSVRLSVTTTEGPIDSLALLKANKTDLAVVRGDEEMPDGAESVAILRKNVVVLWTPSGLPRKGSKKEPKAKIKEIGDLDGHSVGVIGRTEVNVKLLRVILAESGVNPEKVTIKQFGTNQISEMVRDQSLDAFMTVGPLDSKITSDAIITTARVRGEPTFLPVDVSEAIASRHPLYEFEEFPAAPSVHRRRGRTTPSRPSASII